MAKTKQKKSRLRANLPLSVAERERLRGRIAVLCCSDRWAIDVFSFALDHNVGPTMKDLRRWLMTVVFPIGSESVGMYPPGGRKTGMIQVDRTWYPAYYTWQCRDVTETNERGEDVPVFISEDDRLYASFIREVAVRRERRYYLNVISMLLGFPVDDREGDRAQRVSASEAERYGYEETPIKLPDGGAGNDDPLAAAMWIEMRDLGLVLAALRENADQSHLTLKDVKMMTRDIRHMAGVVNRSGKEKRFGKAFALR